MNLDFLQNSRVFLRAPEPGDVDMLFDLENDTRLWRVSGVSVPYSRASLKQYVEQSSHDVFADRQARFMIIRQDDGELLGAIDLFDFDPLHLRAEVGIALLPSYRGKGYASSALSLLCDYCRYYLRFHQLYAMVPQGNTESLRLFSREGFQQCGVLQDWLIDCNKMEDVCLLQKIFHL